MGKVVQKYVAVVGDYPLRAAPTRYDEVGLTVFPEDHGISGVKENEVVEHDSLGAAAATYIRYVHFFYPDFDLWEEAPDHFAFGVRVRRYEEVSKLVLVSEKDL